MLSALLALWPSLALAAPDLPVCLFSRANPKGPRQIEVPINAPTEQLQLDWYLIGPERPGEPAAFLTLKFADGQQQSHRTLMGSNASARPASTAGGLPIRLSAAQTADGQERWGSRQTLTVGRPGVALTSVAISGRQAEATLCLSAARALPEVAWGDVARSTAGWYPFMPAPVIPAPVGMVAEAPAGRRGFLRQDAAGRMVWEDGGRARFWGVNLLGDGAIPELSEAEAFAKTLRNMGFNMARIHHIDREGRGVIDPDRGKPGHDDPFDDARLDRLDRFIAALKAEGIYLWMEVATNREFTAADGISGPGGAPNGHKLYPMWEPDWEAAYLRWFRQLWGRTNPHTGLRYADDPAVAVLELTNEHSLLLMWGAGLEQLPPARLESLRVRWNGWLRERYGTDERLAAAWTGSPRPGLLAGESLAAGTIGREPAWPATAAQWPAQRKADLLAFYEDLERGFFSRLKAEAEAMGFRVPIVPTIQYNRPLLQHLHASFRVSDIHVAYDKGGDGAITGDSLLSRPAWALNMTAAAVEGGALCVSELSQPGPNPYRAEAPWLWATLGSVQDWDALIWIAWSEGAFSVDPTALPRGNDTRSDPILSTQLPAASAAFRNGWLPAATGRFPVVIPAEAVRGGGVTELPRPREILQIPTVLSQRVRTLLTGVAEPEPAPTAPGIGWWAAPGVLFVDRPEAQVRVGPPAATLDQGAGVTALSGLRVDLAEFAAVSLVSADGQPLGQGAATLNVAGDAANTDMRWSADGATIRSPGVGPALVQPLTGTISFRWPRTPAVWRLGPDGRPTTQVPVRGKKGWWTVEAAGLMTPWLRVE